MQNGFVESVNGSFRDELLDGEIFYSLKKAQILIEHGRKHYNTKRPTQRFGISTAYTNPSTNSYKRLVPGYEAPVLLAYSSRNRSASCRIPFSSSPKAKRVEVRFPDPTANPYLCFSALLMAGLDGIKNKLHPGNAMDKNLYDLPAEELAEIPTVCRPPCRSVLPVMAIC